MPWFGETSSKLSGRERGREGWGGGSIWIYTCLNEANNSKGGLENLKEITVSQDNQMAVLITPGYEKHTPSDESLQMWHRKD